MHIIVFATAVCNSVITVMHILTYLWKWLMAVRILFGRVMKMIIFYKRIKNETRRLDCQRKLKYRCICGGWYNRSKASVCK